MKPLLLIITILFLNTSISKQRYYKWTDENGSIHYTTEKPENNETEELDISTRQSDVPTKPAQQQQQAAPEESEEPAEKSYLEQRREKKTSQKTGQTKQRTNH